MRREFLSLCALACLAAALTMGPATGNVDGPGEGWELQFSDDFDRDELGPAWSGGMARVEDGALIIGAEGAGGNNFVFTRQDFPGAQRVEFEARAPTDRPCDLSVVLGCDHGGYNSGFFFGFGSRWNTESRLLLRGEEVADSAARIVPGKWHRVVAQREGHRFTHSIDGEVVLDYTHPGPLPGPLNERVGFYVWHVAHIDSVRVYTKPETVEVRALPTPAGPPGIAPHELGVRVLSYPDPGKVLVSVTVPSLPDLPENARLGLEVSLGHSEGARPVLRRHRVAAPGLQEEVVLDATGLAAGDYVVTVQLAGPGGEMLDRKVEQARWPGRSEAFKDIRILNNFVWELLNVRAEPGGPSLEGAHAITLPYDRWLLVRSKVPEGQRASVAVTLRTEEEDIPFTRHGPDRPKTAEAMRFVKAGEHFVHVEAGEGGSLEHLQVRAVPEIQHSRYPTTTFHVDQGVEYDWDFLRRHILPNVNTIISSGVPERAVPRIEEWRERGGKWITYMGRPGLHGRREVEETPEACFEYYAARPGYAHPLVDGVLVDEFYHREDETYPVYTEAVRRLNAAFPGRAFYPYAAGAFGKDEGSIPFAEACIEGGGRVAWEAYISEWPTLKQGLNALRRYPHVHIIPFEDALPGVTRNTIWVFGAFSFPWPYADGYASVNYNAYLDMQFQLIATHPALFGLGGVHIWRSGYCDEERVRWFGRFFRHYCIEGNTGRLSADPYVLTHIRNPDFEHGEEGWNLRPAEEDSITAGEVEGFGRFIGRYYRGPDTFLITRRHEDRPNVFTQEITGLQVGGLYSVKMFTGDYGAFLADSSLREVHAVSLNIEGGQLLTGPRHSYQHPFPTRRPLHGFSREAPFWLNYHWQVFRATRTRATLRISDWESPDEPGGPVNQQLLYTFVEVKPYMDDHTL